MFGASDVPLVAGRAPQHPRRPGKGTGGGRAFHDIHTPDSLKRGPRHRVESLDAPRSLGTADEGAHDRRHAPTIAKRFATQHRVSITWPLTPHPGPKDEPVSDATDVFYEQVG